MSIAYCNTEHMLVDLFTKLLQGSLFVKLHGLIMGWKHKYNLKMGPTSTNDCVVNINKIEPSKEVIKSNIEKKVEKVGRKKSYTDIVTHRNNKQHDSRK